MVAAVVFVAVVVVVAAVAVVVVVVVVVVVQYAICIRTGPLSTFLRNEFLPVVYQGPLSCLLVNVWH